MVDEELRAYAIALFSSRSSSLVEIKCYCGASSGETLADRDRFGLPCRTIVCSRCGTIRTTPTVSPSFTEEYYRDHYRKLHPWTASISRVENDRRAGKTIWQGVRYFRPSGAGGIAEVGAGTAGALRYIDMMTPHHGPRAAIDLDPDNDGVQFGTVADLAPYDLDLVFSSHVLEHMADPVTSLEQWRDHVRIGGLVAFAVPDVDTIKDHAGWWDHAHPWNWTSSSVRIPVSMCGLDLGGIRLVEPGEISRCGSLVVVAQRVALWPR